MEQPDEPTLLRQLQVQLVDARQSGDTAEARRLFRLIGATSRAAAAAAAAPAAAPSQPTPTRASAPPLPPPQTLYSRADATTLAAASAPPPDVPHGAGSVAPAVLDWGTEGSGGA